jgi:hypothetical protein
LRRKLKSNSDDRIESNAHDRSREARHRQTADAFAFARPCLKLDTQGYGAIVARSGNDLIRKFIGIQTEVSFKRIYADSLPFRDTASFYTGLGFMLVASCRTTKSIFRA